MSIGTLSRQLERSLRRISTCLGADRISRFGTGGSFVLAARYVNAKSSDLVSVSFEVSTTLKEMFEAPTNASRFPHETSRPEIVQDNNIQKTQMLYMWYLMRPVPHRLNLAFDSRSLTTTRAPRPASLGGKAATAGDGSYWSVAPIGRPSSLV